MIIKQNNNKTAKNLHPMLNKKRLTLSLVFGMAILSYTPLQAQVQQKLTTIIVDAGHGGKDAGAVGQYENSLRTTEKDVTLAISKKVVAELKKHTNY